MRFFWAAISILAACGGGKSDGADAMPMTMDTPDAMVSADADTPTASGDGVEIDIDSVQALPAAGDPIACVDLTSACRRRGADLYETSHPKFRVTGKARSTVPGGPRATLSVSGVDVPIDANNFFTYDFELPPNDCSVPLLPLSVTFSATTPIATAPANATLRFVNDGCAPAQQWPDGTAGQPLGAVDNEQSYARSFTTDGRVPCLWRNKTGAPQTATNPAIVPTLTKFQANLRGAGANVDLTGPTNLGTSTGCADGVTYDTAPPSSTTHEKAGPNPIAYHVLVKDNYGQPLTVSATLTAPGGATFTGTGSVTPNASNPLTLTQARVTVSSTPAASVDGTANVVFADLDLTPGTYSLQIKVIDSVGRESAPATAQFTLAILAGPMAPPVKEAVGSQSNPEGGMDVLRADALHAGSNFETYRDSGTYFIVQRLSFHNRTFRPLVVTMAGASTAQYATWQRWRVKAAGTYNYESGVWDPGCPVSPVQGWSGLHSAPDGWPAVGVKFASKDATGTCLLPSCNRIQFAPGSQSLVLVGMPGLFQVTTGAMLESTAGAIYGNILDSEMQSATFVSTSTVCDEESDCPSPRTCIFPEEPPFIGRCGYCNVTARDRLLAIKSVSTETTGSLNHSISIAPTQPDAAWVATQFNGFGVVLSEDITLP